jgi:beta-glucosidase
MIAAVAAANPHCIVVLENGGPVTMPWIDKVSAIHGGLVPGNPRRGGSGEYYLR